MEKKDFFYIGFSSHQGYLVVMKDRNANNCFIYDDAALYQWNSPEIAISDKEYKKATWNQEDPADYATWQEIKDAGWDKYVINKPE